MGRQKLVCATSLCDYRGWIVRGAYLAHKQPQILRFRADQGSLEALPVTVILAIQSLGCYHFRPQDYVPDSFVQIKCFGLGCEINLQIPNSPADLYYKLYYKL